MEQQQKYVALILVANEEANNNQRECYLTLTEGDNYVVSINRDLNEVVIDDSDGNPHGTFNEEDFNKILDMFFIISAFEFEDGEQLYEYVNNQPLEKTFPLIRFKNAEFEEEEALSNALNGEVIMKGDWYHNKISSVIDGFIEGLEYITPFVTVKEVEVTKEEELFDWLGFYSND